MDHCWRLKCDIIETADEERLIFKQKREKIYDSTTGIVPMETYFEILTVPKTVRHSGHENDLQY